MHHKYIIASKLHSKFILNASKIISKGTHRNVQFRFTHFAVNQSIGIETSVIVNFIEFS